ncbi:MAG TPA: acireductone synthase [Leptospiraceae bacterium]|nr:acireductone synthase [Leptospiraceae bacterium]HMY65457.1 acireductone synthase [Leptospiraceae bacterium]HMZ59978.1 acireductone synthase [Leptospiraceae bacterium]HNF14302.1 acireductone synthase [Leptospiraceae bacterium]HNN04101.1 acireductone synthase [Leptospiraceae bacterium]
MESISLFKHCLFDIEGTIAPISFVHDILFPYSKAKMQTYLEKENLTDSVWQSIQSEYAADLKTGSFQDALERNDISSIYHYIEFLIKTDRKNSGLKEIQGHIWQKGYESGEIKSTIFPDTVQFWEKLQTSFTGISIYSSGSILAQKLILKYSDLGDLTKYVSRYFDTGSGGKREKESYIRIAKDLDTESKYMLFFTDILEEAEAASSAGMTAMVLDRPGNKPQNEHAFPVLHGFYKFL